MSDWESATDPVPRRELTEAEKRHRKALQEKRRAQQRYERQTKEPAISGWRVNPDFDDMGA